jgi:hypothetical protein
MRITVAILAGLCFCLLPGAANGETYSSDHLGFTAEFPAAPIVGDPQGAESDAKGRFISTSVIVKTQVMGVYTAMVTIDSYSVPMQIEPSSTLLAMSRSFAAQLDATITSTKAGKLDGNRARFFTYETRDHSSTGKGVVVVVQAKKPRTYMAVSMHTSLASDSDVAALESFIASFHVK